MTIKGLITASLCLALLSCAPTGDRTGPTAAVSNVTITIGSGGLQGVYFPLAGAICRLVNGRRAEHGIRCVAESTEGSVANLNGIRSGSLDMAIATSDWQNHAYEGNYRFSDAGADRELRSLFALHSESLTVFASRRSGIGRLGDAKGARINIGPQRSGTRFYWNRISAAFGWTSVDFAKQTQLGTNEVQEAFCRGEIDVFFFIFGHPSGITSKMLEDCDARLIEATGADMDKLVRQTPYLRKAVISTNWYPELQRPVQTIGLAPVLTASSRIPDDVVYWVVKSVFDNFDQFKDLHPALTDLTKAGMFRDGLSAPLHPGAIRYYEEAGLL